jgi:hypothetical protein
MDKAAKISECGLYRYELTRRWEAGPDCTFIMLNPSTADAEVDDPTIRRCIGFSKHWGYGGLRVVNLYAYRATKPRDLFQVSNAFGPENAGYLQAAVKDSSVLVAAWGAWTVPLDAASVLEGVPMICLGLTKGGSPRHPLYVKGDVEPCEFLLKL